MSWLVPSIMATMAGTAILAFCYFYLYLQDNKYYLKIWSFSWIVYFMRYVFMLAFLLHQESPFFLIGNQISTLVSGILLLYGSYIFIGKKFPTVFLFASAIDTAWIVIGILNNIPFMAMALPTFTFLAIVYIWSGYVFLKHSKSEKREASIVGTAFIVWGVHKANYPFLRPIAWIAPWGYLFAAVLEFITALGLLLVYFRRTKNELLENQSRLLDAQRIAKIGDWSWGLEDNKLVWSDETYRIFGRSPEKFDVTLESFEKAIHPDDYHRFVHERDAALRENRGVEIEHRIILPDKSVRWVHEISSASADEAGNITKVSGTVQDITDRKNSENKLKSSENKFAKAFRAAPLLMTISAIEDGRYLDVNETFVRSTGFTRDYALGRTSVEIGFISERDHNGISNQIQSEGRVSEIELELNKADGSKMICLYSGETINVEGEQRLLSIAMDITQRKRMEKSIQDSQKMESIGNLAGGIAHDFNNILFPIIGISEMLMEDLPPNSPERESAEEIYRAGKRGSDLVKQILAFSRQSEHKMAPTRIQHILKEVLKLSRSTIPSYIEIHQEIQPDCGMVMADSTQIHQVAMNIITNAFHSMEAEGGTMTIGLKETESENLFSSEKNHKVQKYALLSISDTGNGMSADLLDKIFDPYFTTKEQGKGTGLGLAVVYGIVQEHKGNIKVYSEIGKGTTFNIYLPLMDKSTRTGPVDAAEELQTGHERILLVDDEEPIVRLEKLMLERLGYSVTTRVNSLEALELFKAKPDSFDLIVTDMNMPNMTGEQFAKEAKRIKAGIPIIICTGFSERIDEEKAKTIGISGFLMKPVLKADLAKIVRKVLHKDKTDA